MHPTILHISNDYPDPLVPDKTRAVAALVEGTPGFRHVVYSLNRVNGWSGAAALPFGEDKTALSYRALPKGLLWRRRLNDVARWIESDLKQRGIVPDLVEAHKFSVEGIIGHALAGRYNRPLVCDIQGDSDVKIVRAKPNMRGLYRDIAGRAALFFPYAPWPVRPLSELTGLDPARCRLLPVVPGIDRVSPAPFVGGCKLLTVFNLDSWKRKNLTGMIAAIKALQGRFPDIALDIYGRGKPQSVTAVRRAVGRSGIAGRIHLKGPVPNGSVPDVMKHYAAFLLPSLRETYGLVYAEALFAGVPILYGRDRGIDGYADEGLIGRACDPYDAASIAEGIAFLLTHEQSLKRKIAAAQEQGAFERLRRASILAAYREGLESVLSGESALSG
jgi:glycosyltransferase involved in cell wall biosynthesis